MFKSRSVNRTRHRTAYQRYHDAVGFFTQNAVVVRAVRKFHNVMRTSAHGETNIPSVVHGARRRIVYRLRSVYRAAAARRGYACIATRTPGTLERENARRSDVDWKVIRPVICCHFNGTCRWNAKSTAGRARIRPARKRVYVHTNTHARASVNKSTVQWSH